MNFRDYHDPPERNASTAFPIAVILLSMGVILAYLAIGGAWSENRTDSAVYTPQITDVPRHR
ncbi:hypothetical protein [Ensifer sp. LCM 4579]|uniref:hypothetical protein n=1 Tax=Ensifer sp. LCM 4579 TaxID=1848292 RepID=UPI0008DA30BA|nr:hypothetical protein [Ensifer sp. LCM 4579]OHV78187.1 hypothetical protein LCM4579_26960 [Ensifer sp. LCM 4579]